MTFLMAAMSCLSAKTSSELVRSSGMIFVSPKSLNSVPAPPPKPLTAVRRRSGKAGGASATRRGAVGCQAALAQRSRHPAAGIVATRAAQAAAQAGAAQRSGRRLKELPLLPGIPVPVPAPRLLNALAMSAAFAYLMGMTSESISSGATTSSLSMSSIIRLTLPA